MFRFDEPFGSSLFCEDVRQEVGGQTSYIGVFRTTLAIPTFPLTIPKFTIAVTFNEPLEMAENRDWEIPLKVFAPGDSPDKPVFSGILPVISKGVLDEIKKSDLPEDYDVPKLVTTNAVIMILSFTISQRGRIRVRAVYKDDHVVKLGSMRIDQGVAPPETGDS